MIIYVKFVLNIISFSLILNTSNLADISPHLFPFPFQARTLVISRGRVRALWVTARKLGLVTISNHSSLNSYSNSSARVRRSGLGAEFSSVYNSTNGEEACDASCFVDGFDGDALFDVVAAEAADCNLSNISFANSAVNDCTAPYAYGVTATTVSSGSSGSSNQLRAAATAATASTVMAASVCAGDVFDLAYISQAAGDGDFFGTDSQSGRLWGAAEAKEAAAVARGAVAAVAFAAAGGRSLSMLSPTSSSSSSLPTGDVDADIAAASVNVAGVGAGGMSVTVTDREAGLTLDSDGLSSGSSAAADAGSVALDGFLPWLERASPPYAKRGTSHDQFTRCISPIFVKFMLDCYI